MSIGDRTGEATFGFSAPGEGVEIFSWPVEKGEHVWDSLTMGSSSLDDGCGAGGFFDQARGGRRGFVGGELRLRGFGPS